MAAHEPAAYDRVLVDPPCSDLGTLASRPDARWRKTPDDVERLARIQGGILSAASEVLRPGGTLVYSTCTISPDENEGQIAHTVTGDDFDSGSLAPGATFTFEASEAGTFSYVCTFHPGMEGTHTVR